MGRIAGLISRGGSIAAALFVATIAVTYGAQAHAGPAANAAQQNSAPVTAGEAEKDGTMPQAPWPDANIKYVDPGMPTPEPGDHPVAVLASPGYDAQAIARLRSCNVI